MDHRRHGLPAARPGAGRRLRRAVPPRLPGGRRPRAAGPGHRGAAGARRAADHPPGAARRPLGQRAGAGRQRRRPADAPAARPATGGSVRPAPRGPPARAPASSRRPRRAAARRRRRPPPAGRRGAAAAVWLAGTARFTWARIAPGPRNRAEVTTMVADQRADPAGGHLALAARAVAAPPRAAPWPAQRRPERCSSTATAPSSTTCPYNGDPALVRPVAGARRGWSTACARAASGPASSPTSRASRAGCSRREQVRRVNARVDELLGGFDVWAVCPHADDDGCGCRKPAPGMVLQAAGRARASPRARWWSSATSAPTSAAAAAAGARGVLVPDRRDPARGDRRRAARRRPTWPRPSGRSWSGPVTAGRAPRAGGPARRGRRRAAGRARGARGRRGGRAWCCSSARAGGRPRRCCPASTRSWSGRRRGSSRRPHPLRRAADLRRPGPRGPAAADRRGGRAHLVPPVAAAARAAAPRWPASPRIARDQRGLPRLAARRPPPPDPGDLPEAERALAVAAAAGFALPPGDDGRLAVRRPLPDTSALTGAGRTSCCTPAPRCPRGPGRPSSGRRPLERCRDAGRRVVVTGGPAERRPHRRGRRATAESTSAAGPTLPELAAVLDRAVGGRRRQHRAGAPGRRGRDAGRVAVRPDGAGRALGALRRAAPCVLGDQDAPCRGTRATACPVPGHPCLTSVRPRTTSCDALDALTEAAA